MKKVLVITYTQSGQLDQICHRVTAPFLSDENVQVSYYNIEMEKNFPFPWTGATFFNSFPESFKQIPQKIKAPAANILNQKYDLIILGYQVWYLSPSIPINSFLKSEFAEQIMRQTPVVTVIACRNMWTKAHDKMQVLLKNIGAKHVGNVALIDHAPNLISVITIVKWMFTGNKESYLGIFPKPGISKEDIAHSIQFGEVTLKHFHQNTWTELQPELIDKGAIEIKPFLIMVDRTANRIFEIWSTLILKKDTNRKRWINIFKYYLLFVLFVVSPIVYILFLLTYPLRITRIKKDTIHYQNI